MRVLLVQPPSHSRLGLQSFELPDPLGLEVIAASLMPDHEVAILDMRLDAALRQKLASFRPDAVGVSSCFTADTYNAFQVLDIVKEHSPHVFTFVGGHHATGVHTDFAERAHAVVFGEAEWTVPELVGCWERDTPLDEVSGLAHRRGDARCVTRARRAASLDESPLPARDLVAEYSAHYRLALRRSIALVETSRGCPYRCSFCSIWRFYGQSFRTRSPDRVVEDLRHIDSEHVMFTDDNALASPAHSERIADAIRQSGIRKRYILQARADSIVKCRPLLTRWRELGLDSVFVGFESVSQAELDGYSKGMSSRYCEEAIDVINDLGLRLTCSFIVSPDYDKAQFAALRGFVKRKMRLSTPWFSVLTPLPGTQLYEQRAAELTSGNYELYDLLHSVLPTRLGLSEFYRQLFRLYVSAYYVHLTPGGFRNALRHRPWRTLLAQYWKALRLFRNARPSVVLKHHSMAEGQSSLSSFPPEGSGLRMGAALRVHLGILNRGHSTRPLMD